MHSKNPKFVVELLLRNTSEPELDEVNFGLPGGSPESCRRLKSNDINRAVAVILLKLRAHWPVKRFYVETKKTNCLVKTVLNARNNSGPQQTGLAGLQLQGGDNQKFLHLFRPTTRDKRGLEVDIGSLEEIRVKLGGDDISTDSASLEKAVQKIAAKAGWKLADYKFEHPPAFPQPTAQSEKPPPPSEDKIPAPIKTLFAEAEKLLEKSRLSHVLHEPEHLNERRLSQARLKYEAALKLAAEQNSLRAYAEAIEHLVNVLGMQGEIREGHTALEQAIEWFSRFNRPDGEKKKSAYATARIAFFHELLDDIHLALNFWSESARLFDTLDQHEWVQSCAGIARCKGKLGKTADEIAIWEEVRKRVAGTSDHRLVATVAHDYGVVCMNLGRLPEAKDSFDESEAIAKKFGFEDISFTLRGNRDRLQEKQRSHEVPTLSYADLVEDLFQLAEWFPEKRDDFLPFWLQCRRPELESAIRSTPGLKLLVIQDSSEKFSEIADALQAYGSFFVQLINAPFPETHLSFDRNFVEIPFPCEKPLYSYVDADYWQRNEDGDVITIPNSGRIPSLYWLTPHTCASQSTGHQGRRIDGFQMHLPKQAFDLFFGRTRNEVTQKKLFFLPCSRASLDFDISADFRICDELGLVPLYFGSLPVSRAVQGVLTARVKFPVPHANPTDDLRKHVASLKHTLIRLSSVSENEARAEFADFLAKAEDLERRCICDNVVALEAHMLRVARPAGKLQLAFVASESSGMVQAVQ